MTSSALNQRIDRFVDVLIDRQHPFWSDERNAIVYNEAASAALVLQTFLMVFIGGIGLLIVGKPALGLVTAMVLTVTLGQMLILGVLLRRHVEFDLKTWTKQASGKRKLFGLCTYVFYVACFLWAQFRGSKTGNLDGSTIAGLIVGAAAAIALFVLLGWALKRAVKKRQLLDDTE